MKKISLRQRKVLTLRERGETFRIIAKKLKTHETTVRRAYFSALDKLTEQQIAAEYPDLKEAKSIEAAKDLVKDSPFNPSEIMEACKASGLPVPAVNALLKRMRARVLPLDDTPRNHQVQEFITLLEDKAFRALTYLDDYSFSSASVKDLSTTVGILIEKAQLLKGLPTQIIDVNDRRKLNELLPFLEQEAKRRAIDVTPTKVTG